ncbi:MAG: FG-GAP-like repeat-containing protein [Polyangiaceae bacterium]
MTSSGDYEYTLPIDIPAGRAGMQPSLALRYSSRGGDGLAGVGWSASYGGSEITRCAKTFQIDGFADSPDFAPTDALCLDGQRLIQVNAVAPMSEGAEYRTHRDSFARILAHAPSGEAATSFEVFASDGTIRVYTGYSAKRLPVSLTMDDTPVAPVDVTAVWLLTEERDRNGNAIFYHHAVESDPAPPYAFEHRISSIEYTARKSEAGALLDTPLREVVFKYTDPGVRPDASFRYASGVRWSTTRRLTAIWTYAPNPDDKKRVGIYTFDYEQGKPRSFLRSVKRFDATGTDRLWERTFEWAHAERPEFVVIDPPNLAGGFNESGVLLFDADNDGRDDLLYNGQFCRSASAGAPPFSNCVPLPDIWGRPIDVDGNGTTELLTGSGFITWNPALDAFEPLPYGVPPTANLIDANGDGLVDAFVRGPRQNPNVDYYELEWYLRLNTGNGFAPSVAPSVAAPYKDSKEHPKSVVMDLNGDGRGELHTAFHPNDDDPPSQCATGGNQPWTYKAVGLSTAGVPNVFPAIPQGSMCTKTMVDLNGDGLKDVFVAAGPSSTVRYNTGTRFLPEEPFSSSILPRLGEHHRLEVADIDGDGREDIFSSQQASTFHGSDHLPGTHLHLTRNGTFTTRNLGEAPFEIPAYDPEGTDPNIANQSPIVKAADVNGDGLTDLVVVLREYQQWSKVRVLQQQWAPHDVITAVFDQPGTEPRESIFYSPFTTDNPSPADCTYPSVCVRRGMTTAREHWTHRQDEPGSIRRMAYEFDDPRSGAAGRGFLGFGKVRVVDLDSFAETVTYFDHATVDGGLFPFAGTPSDIWRITPILKTETGPLGGVILPQVGNTVTARISHAHYERERRFTNGGATHAVFPAEDRTDEWEQHVDFTPEGLVLVNDGSATPARVRHATHVVDDFGNELASTAWTDGGQRCEVSSTYQNDTAEWLIGFATSRQSTCNKDGEPLPEPRRTTFTPDAKGQLKVVTVEPDHPELSTVTEYDRDPRGLVTRVTVSAQGLSPRKTFLAYDSEGVYPRATWNELGRYKRQLVHPAYGVPILGEDPNGIQIRYLYDGFGRLRETHPDDGVTTVVSYEQDPVRPWAIVITRSGEDGSLSASPWTIRAALSSPPTSPSTASGSTAESNTTASASKHSPIAPRWASLPHSPPSPPSTLSVAP